MIMVSPVTDLDGTERSTSLQLAVDKLAGTLGDT